MENDAQVRRDVVEDFGREWSRFQQAKLTNRETADMFREYFSVFPWEQLPDGAKGFDLGCGSGRLAKMVAPRVGTLYCVEPSAAIDVARKNLAELHNVEFIQATVEEFPVQLKEMDFGYAIGVLHHVNDTAAALRRCVQALKFGAPFLVYIYYAFDNRPTWYRSLWEVSNRLRNVICQLPTRPKNMISDAIATTVYFPLSRLASLGEAAGLNVDNVPLAAYRNRSFHTLRTDALDRFGTKLEKRFTRSEIHKMMTDAGLIDIKFDDGLPYWCAVGYRAA